MPTSSLKSIESQISKLEARAQALRKKQRTPAIAQIVQQMKAHDISVEEIAEALEKPARGRQRGAKNPGKTAGRRTAAGVPKYRNPDTGATWSGRGRAPRWIVEAEQAGRARESFRI